MRRKPDGARQPRRPTSTPARARRRSQWDAGARDPASADRTSEADERDVQRLGPYERRYDVVRGYGIERTVVRP